MMGRLRRFPARRQLRRPGQRLVDGAVPLGEAQEGVELAWAGVGVELEADPNGVKSHGRYLGHRERATEVEVALNVDRPVRCGTTPLVDLGEYAASVYPLRHAGTFIRHPGTGRCCIAVPSAAIRRATSPSLTCRWGAIRSDSPRTQASH